MYGSKKIKQTPLINDWIVLFDTQIGLYQVLPIWVKVDMGVMAMK